LSDTTDTAVSGAGAAGAPAVSDATASAGPDGGAPQARASRSLLLVLEPGGADTPAGASLLAEGSRLAAHLGIAVKALTWNAGESGEPAGVGAVAAVLVASVAAAAAPAAVLFVDSDLGRELAPLVAHRLGCGAVLGCSDMLGGESGGLVFMKPVYGGWLEQETRVGDAAAVVVTLDLSGIEVAAPAGDQAPAIDVLSVPATVAAGEPRVRRLELLPPDAKSVDLVHARRIVSAGMGAADEELLAAVTELADLLDGSVGATRPVVDEGRLPKERLIGQTGRTVTPDLYVALGISGSPHHIAGVRKADTILSVNRDPRAPIFQFSDVGYVADLREVLPALVTKIKEWRDAGE
jgi:electron transfer flavoprotein alpha subunit